jgi:glycosyltransferase involved in cell wall biosynthesis
MIDVVVNYYNRANYPALVEASAKLCLSCYRRDPRVAAIWLIDGSADRDQALSVWCQKTDVHYLHAGRPLTFAEGFNLGISQCHSDWIALSASDIYIPDAFFERAQAFIVGLEQQSIGCLVPALTSCDIPSQERCGTRQRQTGLMSLNLNLFPAPVLKAIGGVPEQYSGAYNDVEICLRLRQHNLSIYQLPIAALHYGKLTISQGSAYTFEADQSNFFDSHPELFSAKSLCNLKLDKFQRGWKRLLFQTERSIPLGRFRDPVQKWLWKQFG